jgi:hypothetical protein
VVKYIKVVAAEGFPHCLHRLWEGRDKLMEGLNFHILFRPCVSSRRELISPSVYRDFCFFLFWYVCPQVQVRE